MQSSWRSEPRRKRRPEWWARVLSSQTACSQACFFGVSRSDFPHTHTRTALCGVCLSLPRPLLSYDSLERAHTRLVELTNATGVMDTASRHSVDRSAGLLSFDALETYRVRQLNVLWLENTLDCRIWGYYCDIKKAMAKIHRICVVRSPRSCLYQRASNKRFVPDVAVVGPRYAINIQSEDDSLGFDRSRFAQLPLLVLHNKMYDVHGWREVVGNVSAKLAWTRAIGAAGAFTWLTRHHEFTRRSGVPHHWMPFGVDVKTFGALAGAFGKAMQPIDVGFTGASGKDKYPLRNSMLLALKSMNISCFFGTWLQTATHKQAASSWQAGDRTSYAKEIARARIWLSTTGPSNIVGTRYFEVLASGTTLLMCNRPPPGKWIYDGLFEDGVHVVMFDGIEDMRAKVLYYLEHEEERRDIVTRAHEMTARVHSWDARARFLSFAAEAAIAKSWTGNMQERGRYVPPPWAIRANHSSFVGCYQAGKEQLHEPLKSRNKRKLWRYTVAMCVTSCRDSGHALAALIDGGFSSGNGHAHAQCKCARARSILDASSWIRASDLECASTCNLHDSRPCGSSKHYAFYNVSAA